MSNNFLKDEKDKLIEDQYFPSDPFELKSW